MTEIKRLIDEKTFGRLQALKERLPHDKKEKSRLEDAPRRKGKKEHDGRQGLGAESFRGNRKRRARTRNKNKTT